LCKRNRGELQTAQNRGGGRKAPDAERKTGKAKNKTQGRRAGHLDSACKGTEAKHQAQYFTAASSMGLGTRRGTALQEKTKRRRSMITQPKRLNSSKKIEEEKILKNLNGMDECEKFTIYGKGEASRATRGCQKTS